MTTYCLPYVDCGLIVQGEDMDADRIFVTSSMQEAMFLLEHCTNLAIGNVSSSSSSSPGLVLGLQLSMEIITKHEMKEQYRIEEMLSAWLISNQDSAVLFFLFLLLLLLLLILLLCCAKLCL